jgi:hypothetical protein
VNSYEDYSRTVLEAKFSKTSQCVLFPKTCNEILMELSSRMLEAKFLKNKISAFDFRKICAEILMSFTLVKSSQDTVEAKLSKKIFFICKAMSRYMRCSILEESPPRQC